MAADERIHGEVVRGSLSDRRMRAAGGASRRVYRRNDGLVSNFWHS
ncbi:MAG: hypothetical protein R2717_00095 [Schumannella sp.]